MTVVCCTTGNGLIITAGLQHGNWVKRFCLQPVVADFHEALTVGRADGALAASLFHDRALSVHQVKRYLVERGVRVREGI